MISARNLCAAFLTATFLTAAEPPTATLTGEGMTVKFFLPDAQTGYYQGTRFDWSGQIGSLRTAKHEYFGQWFDQYDPKRHDAIQGPVEEFNADGPGLGFDEAAPGGTFMRIGIGVVRRPDAKPYERFRTYEVVDPGKWKVKTSKNKIVFTHTLRHPAGYAYRYTKTVTLAGPNEMVIEHALQNTGKKLLPALQYNHNFFVMDGQPTGSKTHVDFPFSLQAQRAPNEALAKVSGGSIRYNRSLEKGESVFGTFKGFGSSASDYDIKVANLESGAAVRIRGDRPLEQLVFWSIRTTVCPEPYIRVDAAPGTTSRWSYRYNFK